MTKKTNNRRFSIAESVFLNETMQEALTIIYRLDDITEQHGITVDEISTPCVIRADLAYDLCSSITHMYEKLVDNELIHSGSKVYNKTLH